MGKTRFCSLGLSDVELAPCRGSLSGPGILLNFFGGPSHPRARSSSWCLEVSLLRARMWCRNRLTPHRAQEEPGGEAGFGRGGWRTERKTQNHRPGSRAHTAVPKKPQGTSDGSSLPSDLRPRAGGGRVAPTSQKHQDASVGEHGCGHPVGVAGRPPGRGGVGAGCPVAADSGSPPGSCEEVARVLRPPRRSHALTSRAVDGCKSSCALIGPSCQKRWRQPRALRALPRPRPALWRSSSSHSEPPVDPAPCPGSCLPARSLQ